MRVDLQLTLPACPMHFSIKLIFSVGSGSGRKGDEKNSFRKQRHEFDLKTRTSCTKEER